MAIFRLASTVFARKSDAVAAVREILNTAELNRPLAGEQHDLVAACFALHPGNAIKSAGGVAGFLVKIIQYRPGILQRCFHVIHADGSLTDFSYRKCFGMAQRDGGLAEAGRYAVAETVHAFKLAQFKGGRVACALSGRPLAIGEAAVDHAPPWHFAAILRAFVAAHGKPDLRDLGVTMAFAREEDAELFRNFHNERARLRILCARLNIDRKSVV